MNTWIIVASASGAELFSDNYLIAGTCTWVLGFSLLRLAVARGLLG